jgi:hypothetical protein
MELKIIIDDEEYSLNVPDEIVQGAGEFFQKMDSDMDQGWQMSRDWVARPDRVQRLQIVGNKLLTALENENHDLGRLMAGYILSRAPEIDSLVLDTAGEMQNTEVRFKAQPQGGVSFASAADVQPDMPDAEARAEAERQVSGVYKTGRHFCFSVMNPESGAWETVTTGDDETKAERRRREVLLQRYNALAARH